MIPILGLFPTVLLQSYVGFFSSTLQISVVRSITSSSAIHGEAEVAAAGPDLQVLLLLRSHATMGLYGWRCTMYGRAEEAW